MPKFLIDLFDVLRLRFQPLAHYVYPAWQPVGALLLVGFIGGAGAMGMKAGLIERAGFMMAMNLLQIVLLTFWLMIWWRFVLKRPVQGSLFPLVALVNSAHFLIVLAAILVLVLMAPISVELLMLTIMGLGLWVLFLTIAAVAAALNERRVTVLLALLAYLPTALSISQIAMGLMLDWGWVVMPTMPDMPAAKPV